MRFSLVVLSAPASAQAATTALRFAEAALAAGHAIRQVFFYGAGVAALARGETPADELDVDAAWRALAARHGFPVLACRSAAARQGLDALPDARRGAVGAGTLGQLMAALDDTDRVVSFGA